MAKIIDPNTGEYLGLTPDDPMYEAPKASSAGALDRFNAEMSAKAEAAASAEAARENSRGAAFSNISNGDAPQPNSSMTTIRDDYGNEITFDRNNPNPEASTTSYSSSNYSDPENNPPVAPDPNYQDSAAASDAGNLGSGSSIGGGQRDSNMMDATNTYGSAAEVAGAGSDIGNLGSSVSSSLGGITETGKMFSSATEAAGNAATGELTNVLNSVPSAALGNVLGSIPNLAANVGKLATSGNIIGLVGALSKGLSPTAIAGLASGIAIGNLASKALGLAGQVSSNFKTPSDINDASGHSKMLAEYAAARNGMNSIVSVNGKEFSAPIPARPMDILMKSKGTPMTSIPPDPRAVANYARQCAEMGYTPSGGDDGAGPSPPGMPKGVASTANNMFGQVRDSRAMVPGMEALMFDVKGSALGKFTSLLPPTFKSLLPLGAVAGLVSKGPVSLGGLTQLVGGAALGAVASQALRSVGTGGISTVSGMSGLLGAQALARTVGTGTIPVNIASTFANAAVGGMAGRVAGSLASNVLGTNPSTTATIANVVGVVATVSLNKNLSGIPLSSQALGLAANVALRSAGISTAIPTGVLGTAASFASNPLSSMVGSLVSGRVPIIPTNLSIGNIGALSGLTQNLQGLGLAENIIPRSQLSGLLPPNLRNQINTAVPPRMRQPGYSNETEDRNRSASTRVPDSENQPRTGSTTPAKPALVKGAANGSVDYEMKISKYFTLGAVSIKVHGDVSRVDEHKFSKYTTNQHIEGLSWMAVNVLDPLYERFNGLTIISGFRGPGAATPHGEHGRGAAIDAAPPRSYGMVRSKCLELAKAMRQMGLPCGWCALESTPSAKYSWVHLGGSYGHPTAKDVKPHDVSCWDAGCGNHYTEGWVMRPGDP